MFSNKFPSLNKMWNLSFIALKPQAVVTLSLGMREVAGLCPGVAFSFGVFLNEISLANLPNLHKLFALFA